MEDKTQEKAMIICQNKKNINKIQEYLKSLEDGKDGEVVEAASVLSAVFSFYSQKGILKGNNNAELQQDNPESSVGSWIQTSFKAYIDILLRLISHSLNSIQKAAIDNVMSMLQVDHLLEKSNFPNQMFIKVVKSMIFKADLTTELMQSFYKYLEFDDVRFYCLKNCHSLIQQHKSVLMSPQQQSIKITDRNKIVENIHSILNAALKYEKHDGEEMAFFLNDVTEDEDRIKVIGKYYKTSFTSAWFSVLRIPNLPATVHKNILVNMDTKILPNLSDPKLLIDFLTDSYNISGVIGLLALNSLFVLINQYNLDYPDFYTKLYNLLDPNVFTTKYKDRFLYLLNLFLTSNHLPTYLVASFIKKLARISLFTPGPDVPHLLVLIRNLLIRHSTCRILVHRKSNNDAQNGTRTDPYDYEATDPKQSNAIKSCLWELNTLKSHYSSDVLKAVALFRKEFPLVEDESNETNFEEIFVEKMKENSTKDTPLNFETNNSIFNDDQTMWAIE